MDMNKSTEQGDLDLCAVRRLTWRKCVPSEHPCLRALPLRAAFTTVLASSSFRKNAELNQRLATLQSGKKPARFSIFTSVLFWGSKLKQGMPPIQEQGKAEVGMETILSRLVPLLWNSAHCFLTNRRLCVTFDPLEASQQFSWFEYWGDCQHPAWSLRALPALEGLMG